MFHSLTLNAHWNHIRSRDNPADLISQGCSAAELVSNILWWYAPICLEESITTWPAAPDDPAIDITLSTEIASEIAKQKTLPQSEIMLTNA